VHSIRVSDCLTPRWHLTELLSQIRSWQSILSSLHSLSELILTQESIIVVILNPILHLIPYFLDRVQIGRKREPFDIVYAPFAEILYCQGSRIRRGRILHKNKLISSVSVQPKLTLNNRDNLLLISRYVNRALFFLLKDTWPLDIPVETAPKHPPFTSLIALDYASRVPFFTSSTCNVRLCIPIPINPSLITLKYPLLVFIYLIEMLNSLLEPSESITLSNRGFSTCNSTRKPCPSKGISDVIVAHIKPYHNRNLIP
jgi:hypothetical protein